MMTSKSKGKKHRHKYCYVKTVFLGQSKKDPRCFNEIVNLVCCECGKVKP